MTRRKTRAPHHDLSKENRSNELFEKFYKSLKIVEDTEWTGFVDSLRSDLPATFRLTGFGTHYETMYEFLNTNYFQRITKSIQSNNELKEITLKNLEWYPNKLAWQLDASKMVIRKNDAFKDLFKFLISETESGYMSRQEAVSMIPPLLLDVKHDSLVLDLCAAPGSKSAQLVEMIHKDFEEKGLSGTPSGVVIANDLELTRSYIMVHQLKRLKSPCYMVTKEDAAIYPKLQIKTEDGCQPILYDRILADVPCSGDGTLRKNPQIWLNWKPNQGNNEHVIQHRILKRGLELLREDGLGRLVYSTCSLNPVEDEAVVADMLSICQGSVELVEPPSWITNGQSTEGSFKSRAGLKNWHLIMKSGEICQTYEDIPEKNKSSYRRSMFPPENIHELNLERCRRIIPSDQNTGGFFIAILTKTRTLPWMRQKKADEDSLAIPIETDQVAPKTTEESKPEAAPQKAGRQNNYCKFNENPFNYINPVEDADWKSIHDYYQLTNDPNGRPFPSHLILYRPSDNPEQKKRNNLYYTNETIKNIIEGNNRKSFHIVNCGVGIFTYCDDKQYNGYRITQEGGEIISPYLVNKATHGRMLIIDGNEADSLNDLLILLNEEIPLIDKFSKSLQEQWEKISVGPVIIRYEAVKNATKYPKVSFNLTGWRGIRSVRQYLKQHERSHYLRLSGVTEIMDSIKMENNTTDEGPKEKVPRIET